MKKTNQTIASAFVHALKGLFYFFRHERNGKIQLFVGFATIIATAVLGCTPLEWCVLLGCIALVIGLEMINSAVEKLCDLVHPDYHPVIKTVKDVAAAAVLWPSIFSILIGGIILLPRLLHLLYT